MAALDLIGGKIAHDCNRLPIHLNVSEGTVRYRLKRKAQNAVDGRAKTALIEKLGLAAVVNFWWEYQRENLPAGRSPNIRQLWTLLDETAQRRGASARFVKWEERIGVDFWLDGIVMAGNAS